MVVTLNSEKVFNKDDGQAPIDNISYANFWAKVDSSKLPPPEFNPKLYSGPKPDDPGPPPDPKSVFDSERPYNISLDRFNKYGVLLLRADIKHDFGSHPDNGPERHRIITFAGETGDVAHVAGALAADPLTDVLLLTNSDIDEKQTKDILRTFRNAVRKETCSAQHDYERLNDVSHRVRGQDCGDSVNSMVIREALRPEIGGVGRPRWHNLPILSGKEMIEDSLDLWSYTNANGGRAEYVSVTVVGSTYVVAKRFKDLTPPKFYNLMDKCLIEPDFEPDAVQVWANNSAQLSPAAKLLREKGQNVLLVWSRYSGQNTETGYNPAGDSDHVKGQDYLIALGKEFKPRLLTVTIGHDPANGKTPEGEIHLGEFWKDENTPFFGKGRPGQSSFYVALRERHNVVQIGQKTGGMDNAALLGIPTVYIEDKDSHAIARMKTWEEAGFQYRCACIDLPPTPLGKALRHPDAKDRRWKAKEMLEKNPNGFAHGYINMDGDKIKKTLEKVWPGDKTSITYP